MLEEAQRQFMSGKRVDVQAIATDLSVGRTTIHRWFGGREGLVQEILLTQFGAVFDHALAVSPWPPCPQRVLDTLSTANRTLAASEPLKRFLAEEQALALRLITLSTGVIHLSVTGRVQALLEDAMRGANWQPTLEVGLLAYSLVRISEAFLYQDAMVGPHGNVEHLNEVTAALLGVAPRPAG